MTALFDSLTHPTIDGGWLSTDRDARVEPLLAALRENGFGRACAVGLPGVNGYDHAAFAALCRPHEELVPVAGVDPHAPDIAAQFDAIRELGYRAVKLHPRLSSFRLDDDVFVAALQAARDRDLVVFLCTYLHTSIPAYPPHDPIYALVRSLQSAPGVRVVLLHGGDVDLLRWAQVARHDEHLLLDVSYTLMKYPGSSLDADLRYLFSHFHRRTCIGSDHPEWPHDRVRARFDELTAGLSDEAQADVGHRSLSRFLGLDPAWE
jgi:predicted TIM-barrel fold metal-dependent hydrolase